MQMVLYLWKMNQTSGKYERTYAIDSASSVIWVQRYNDAGDFEIYIRASENLWNQFYSYKYETFITRAGSDAVMVVEKIVTQTDAENGDFITISGRSAESLLGRRIIRYQTNFTGTAENCIRQLITENVISPSDAARKMDIIRLGAAQGYTDEISVQFTGDNLLDAVSGICKRFRYGFKLTWDGEYFTFSLYQGTNRTAAQTETDPVVFSAERENLLSSEHTFDKTGFITSVYTAGEGEGSARIIGNVSYDGYPMDGGLWRREMWNDQRGLSRTTDDGQMPLDEYYKALAAKSREELAEHLFILRFEGDVLPNYGYTFGVNYFLGDKVTARNAYGVSASSTISEVTEVEDETGYRIIPTFSDWSV